MSKNWRAPPNCVGVRLWVTKTIQLGAGIGLVPERNPLLLAKAITTLDQLSGGRFP